MARYEALTTKRSNNDLLPSATKLRRLCFYTCLSVILFTGGLPQCMLGYPLGPGTPRWDQADPPEADPSGPGHPPGTRHPPQQTATVADGTNPTGMHSCYSWGFILVAHDKWKVMTRSSLQELPLNEKRTAISSQFIHFSTICFEKQRWPNAHCATQRLNTKQPNVTK